MDRSSCIPKQLLFVEIEMFFHTSLHRACYQLSLAGILFGIVLSACGPKIVNLPVQNSQSSTQELIKTLVVPTHRLESSATQQEILLPTKVPITPTITAIENPELVKVDFRVTYQTYELDDKQEVRKSQLWVLYPPYQTPQLLYGTEEGNHNLIASMVVWAHNGHQAAFVHYVGDNNHVALSILDTQTHKLSQVTEVFSIEDPSHTVYTMSWSFDDQWIYLDLNYGFVDGRILNTQSHEAYLLDQKKQDELVAWSPTAFDEYAYISRNDFYNLQDDTICIGKAIQKTPPKCSEIYNHLVPVSTYPFVWHIGHTFSWALHGKQALVITGSGGPDATYLLFDFDKEQWKIVLSGELFFLSNYWSPDGKWIIFYDFTRGIYLLNILNETPQLIPVTDSQNSAIPLGWLSDGSKLIYQDQFAVYAFDPNNPSESVLIKDFSSVLKSLTNDFQIDLLN
jgi:hypothetical protein